MDLVGQRVVSAAEVMELCAQLAIGYMEISSKTGVGVLEVFHTGWLGDKQLANVQASTLETIVEPRWPCYQYQTIKKQCPWCSSQCGFFTQLLRWFIRA